jgi:hypothetical protein
MSEREKETAAPRSRDWHRDYAEANNYFWLPCPLCGEMFGGHEKGAGMLYRGSGRGVGTCAGCADKARQISADVLKAEGKEGEAWG